MITFFCADWKQQRFIFRFRYWRTCKQLDLVKIAVPVIAVFARVAAVDFSLSPSAIHHPILLFTTPTTLHSVLLHWPSDNGNIPSSNAFLVPRPATFELGSRTVSEVALGVPFSVPELYKLTSFFLDRRIKDLYLFVANIVSSHSLGLTAPGLDRTDEIGQPTSGESYIVST